MGENAEKNNLTNNSQNSVIIWKPAFIDDRVIISWDNEVDKYVAIVKRCPKWKYIKQTS